MKNITFLSIFLWSIFNFAYSEIYEGKLDNYVDIFAAGSIYINLSSYPNDEYFFIEFYYDSNTDFSSFTYALKNETNFTNLKGVDFYRKTIRDNKIRYYYVTFQKLNNFKYLLLYFNLGFYMKCKFYIHKNTINQIPKYGSAIGLYNSLFYLNLSNFNISENIYIQVQFNITVDFNKICLYNSQCDYFGMDHSYNYECSNLYKKINNNSYIFYFNYTKENKYIFLRTNLYYYMNISLKNAKADESPKKKEKNKDKGFTNKYTIALVITLITAIILIILSIYIFVLRPSKNTNSDYVETLN